MPIPDDCMQIATVDDLMNTEDNLNHKRFKTYREYKNSDIKKQLGVKMCDRHNYFKMLEPELISDCRRVVYDNTIASVADKVQLMLGALKLQYEVNDVESMSFPMKSFELINNDYDCYLLFHKNEFFEGIFDYLKLMLSM
jgi:R2D2